ncbi:hypothetical protein MTO96_052193 [Rhipicephalus appendiculatus]
MANRFRTPTRDVDTWQIVRGDDMQVVSGYYLDVLAVKLGYDALGAEANEGRIPLVASMGPQGPARGEQAGDGSAAQVGSLGRDQGRVSCIPWRSLKMPHTRLLPRQNRGLHLRCRGPSCLVLPASRFLRLTPRRSSRAPRQLR